MPLTARLGDAVIRAFDDGATEAACRDSECGAKVIAVKAHVVDDDIVRVAHWRHVVSVERTCAAEKGDRDHMSPWHAGWQGEADSPHRIEVPIHGKRADILTKFGWVIEVQHSGIRGTTVASREAAHRGRVIWLVDAASNDAPFHISQLGDIVRVIGPNWMLGTKTLLAVDDGDAVWLLPKFATQRQAGGSIALPRSVILSKTTRAQFVADWINGGMLPIPADSARTLWMIESRRPKSAPKEPVEHRRAKDDQWDNCGFGGDRDNLVAASGACSTCGQISMGMADGECAGCQSKPSPRVRDLGVVQGYYVYEFCHCARCRAPIELRGRVVGRALCPACEYARDFGVPRIHEGVLVP